MTLVLPRLPESVSLQHWTAPTSGGPFCSGESVRVPATICCFPPAPNPHETWYPPDQNSPHATPCPTQPVSNPYPPSALAWRERGRVSSWEPEGFSYKPPSFVVVISPSFLPFILKIALSLQAPPHPPPPTGREHLLKDNVIPGPGPEAGIPRPGFLGEGGLKDWNLGGQGRGVKGGRGGRALGAHSLPLCE